MCLLNLLFKHASFSSFLMALFKFCNHRFKFLVTIPYGFSYNVPKFSVAIKQRSSFNSSLSRSSLKKPKCWTVWNFCSSYSKALSLNSPQVHVERVPGEIKVTKSGIFVLEGQKLSDLQQCEFDVISQKFNLKKLKRTCLEKYEVKISDDGNSLFFPMNDFDGNIISIQKLSYNSKLGELEENIFPRDVASAVYGWSLASQEKECIVVTNNCLDAIAANQELDIPAIAIPFENETFPLPALNFLEPFKKIFFWFTEHLHDCRLHMQFAEKFGKRAFVVSPHDVGCTALSCLQNGDNLKNIIKSAVTLKPDDVLSFSDFEDGVRAEFKDYEVFCGVKWSRFDVLNDLLKGLRKGELTVFSGQSGVGKTTFMSEYSLDLCIQGVPTLWGSFEVKNTRLAKTMLTQFSRCNLIEEPENKFNYWFSEFKKLRLFFMEFNQQQSIQRILLAMSNMVRAYGIQHVVIDNLQFMLYNTVSERSSSTIDLFCKQDQMFSSFRTFASQHNCHVTLVMHPRKEPELSELSITSISGTARATQEADNVLLMQTTQNKQYLQVKKNRFTGTKGCVLLEFDEKTLTYTIKKVAPRHQITPKR